MSATTTPAATAPPALLTADEFMDRYAGVLAELVKGVVREVPMSGADHGYVCLEIGSLLRDYCRRHDVGRAMCNDTRVKTGSDPDTVRGGDVVYVSYERLPKSTKLPEKLLSVVPDLVVEIRSPSDRWTDVFTKVVEYLKSGVRAVIVIDPKTASASVCRDGDDEFQQIFHNGDELTVPEILPGFSVRVADLFQ